MWRFSLLLCFLLSGCCLLFSQNQLVLKGRVTDGQEPLPFAHVYLKNELIGTATNGDGYFELHFTGPTNDSLVISCLGYDSFIKAVNQLANDTVCAYELKELPVELGSVIVLPESLSARKIVDNAFKNRRKNFPSKNYCLEGFYRRTGLIEQKYGSVVEAAVAVKVKDYVFDNERDEIVIYEARSSNNDLEQSSFWAKKFDAIMRYVSGYETINEIYEFLKPFGLVKFEKGELDLYHYTVQNVIFNPDSSKTFVVNYQSNKFRNSRVFLGGTLYINSSDWGIEKCTFRFEIDMPHEQSDFTPGIQEVTYRKIDGKYFPVIVRHRIVGGGEVSTSYRTEEGKELSQFHETLFVVNKVDAKMRNYRHQFQHQILQRTELFDPSKYPYHPEFWKTYNLLQLNPQDKKMIEDLSENMPLEQQFKKNGKQ
jgi:hypothetical protein